MQEETIYNTFEKAFEERLDTYLSKLTGQTRSLIQQSIREGLISVNKQIITKTGYKLEAGNVISGSINLRLTSSESLKAENIPLEVIFEDADLLVINKAAGLIVHPTASLREGTLVNALIGKYQESLSDLNNTDGFRPGIVHRLDKDTSGLMLVAKTNKAHLSLSEQLSSRTLKRTYWALAVGQFKENSGSIEAPIGRHPSDRKKMAVVKNESHKTRFALTHWEIIEEYKQATLLKIQLATGRTHQIRVHLDYINHPILGDPVYGGKQSKTHLINRQCLHAKGIQFIHPSSNESMFFTSELPNDFLKVLQNLLV